MTMPAFAETLGSRLPSATEQEAANQLRLVIAGSGEAEETRLLFTLADKRPAEIVLAPALRDLLMQLLRHIGSGDAVTLVPLSQQLTTQQAADLLNVSRPFLITLLDRGDIPHTLIGRHRRIEAEALFAYKRRRDVNRARALDALMEADAELL